MEPLSVAETAERRGAQPLGEELSGRAEAESASQESAEAQQQGDKDKRLLNVVEEAFASITPSALSVLEERLNEPGADIGREEAVQAIRDAVMQEVDQRVAAKAEELWVKGKQMLNQMQQKHKDKTELLTEELARCAEKQRALEAENEKLKKVLEDLASRFSALGAAFSGKAPVGSPDAAASTAAGGSPPRTEGSCSDLFTPGPFTPGGDFPSGLLAAMLEVKLPEVPAFPFPAQPAVPMPAAPQLLLSEVLGPQTPQRTPLSLASSLTHSPSELASPFPPRGLAVTGGTFSFTLRKADGADLGLNVSHNEGDKVLKVEGVRQDGAVEAWNRQCSGGAFAEKAVRKGDKIVSVNNVSGDPVKMLEECREKVLLKLTISRGEWTPPSADASGAATPVWSTTLRAEASVFIPAGAGGGGGGGGAP